MMDKDKRAIENKRSRLHLAKSLCISMPGEISYEEYILNTRKVTIPIPFILSSDKIQKKNTSKGIIKSKLFQSPSHISLKLGKNTFRMFRDYATGQYSPTIKPKSIIHSKDILPISVKSSIKTNHIAAHSSKKVNFNIPTERKNLLVNTYDREIEIGKIKTNHRNIQQIPLSSFKPSLKKLYY